MLVRGGGVWQPHPLYGTMEAGIGRANERSEGVGAKLFEGVKDEMFGGRGEEDHGEGHQVRLTLSPSEFCES